MSGAREAILARIRQGLGRGELSAEQRAGLEQRLSSPPPTVRWAFHEDPLTRFVEKATEKGCTVEQLASVEALPQAVAGYLAANLLPTRISIAPALKSIAWPQDWEINYGPGRIEECTSLTPCFAAVAETGSLVFLSGPQTPTTLNFLPEDHLVVLGRDQILRHFEEVWPGIRQLPEEWPRTVNIVSGPSRTADVGQVIVRPAHGPKRLHIMITPTRA